MAFDIAVRPGQVPQFGKLAHIAAQLALQKFLGIWTAHFDDSVTAQSRTQRAVGVRVLRESIVALVQGLCLFGGMAAV